MKNEMNQETLTPIMLISNAINKGIAVEKMQELFTLKKEFEADEARKAFFRAMLGFQSQCKPILKLKKGHNYKYAPLDDISQLIRPALTNNKLSYRFDQVETLDSMTVRCIVSHVLGHTETTSTSVPIEELNKNNNAINPIQNHIGIQTYTKRKCLENALGLSIANEDTDGTMQKQPNKTISQEQKVTLLKLVKFTNTTDIEIREFYNIDDISKLSASDYSSCLNLLNSRASRQKKLAGETSHG